jgi:class 3 adenylate cyclase
MKCPRCQHENRSGAKFCEECATPLARTCSNCGSQLSAAAKFCPECAQPVAGTTPADARFTSPQSYTPKHLAEKILTSKSALEGERKQVTVLFADLKGSMELLADRDPEEARKILDPVLERMMEAVHHYEGTVNQVMGDGIMALFGAPLAHEDHAVRACYAALRMQENVKRYADEVRRSHAAVVKIRVGLNSGEVVVRAIGSDLHMDYTAVGQTTHLAARMEQAAHPGSIVVTADTMRVAEGYVRAKSLGQLAIKGLSAQVDGYEVTGAGPARTRFQAAAARGLTRFVGRGDEMATLDAGLRRALEGRGLAMGVVGVAGVGKSRLCQEFVELCRARGLSVVEVHCLSHARTAPLGVLRDLLRGAFGVDQNEDRELAREKVSERLVALDPSLVKALPLAHDLFAVGDPSSPTPTIDPIEQERFVAGLLRRLFRALGTADPLLIHLDDAHWIDPQSERLLAELADVASTTRVLLLLNFRPEFQAAWMGRSYYQQLSVGPLGGDATREMICGLLGDDPSVGALSELIRERTQGNPFFIEEIVQALVAEGALAGEHGAYRWTSSCGTLEVPATVQSLLATRMDGLAENDKLVLRTAAVIGKRFYEQVLRQIIDLPSDEVDASLARLEHWEFIHGEAEGEYAFRHPLTQEVAYGSQLLERRSGLHAAVARALEEVLADRLGESAALIAHHWEQAGRRAEAARWRRLAALRVTRILPRRPRLR